MAEVIKHDLESLVADIAQREAKKLYEKRLGGVETLTHQRRFLATNTKALMQPTRPMTASHGEIKVSVFTETMTPPTGGTVKPQGVVNTTEADSPASVLTMTTYTPLAAPAATTNDPVTTPLATTHVAREIRPLGEEVTVQTFALMPKPEPEIETAVPGGPHVGVRVICWADTFCAEDSANTAARTATARNLIECITRTHPRD